MDLIEKLLHLAAENTMPVEYVEKGVAEFRRGICDGCEYRDAKKDKCTVCGCYLDIKVECLTNRNPKQLRHEVTHCPLGKWNDLDTANRYRKIDGLPLLS